MKEEKLTPELEDEIRKLCSASTRGYPVSLKRIGDLYKKYPIQFGVLSSEERKKAQAEMNPLSDYWKNK